MAHSPSVRRLPRRSLLSLLEHLFERRRRKQIRRSVDHLDSHMLRDIGMDPRANERKPAPSDWNVPGHWLS